MRQLVISIPSQGLAQGTPIATLVRSQINGTPVQSVALTVPRALADLNVFRFFQGLGLLLGHAGVVTEINDPRQIESTIERPTTTCLLIRNAEGLSRDLQTKLLSWVQTAPARHLYVVTSKRTDTLVAIGDWTHGFNNLFLSCVLQPSAPRRGRTRSTSARGI